MPNIKKLHSIDSFGIRKVSLSHIRIERLEERIRPTVPFPHKHDFFQIMLVTKGKGYHQIDFMKHKVAPRQVYLMKPGQMHSWELSKEVQGLIVEFNTQSLNFLKDSTTLIHNMTFSPDVHEFQDQRQFHDLLNLTEMMRTEFLQGKDMQDLCLQGYLTGFLIQLIRSYKDWPGLPKGISIIQKFKSLVENHFKNEHAVDFYARTLGLSPQALTMQISRAIGKPPRQIIQERILLEAKRYLVFSDIGIAEIGFELGFDDANYFTRFFRTHEKETPAAFRKLHHGGAT